MTSMPDYDLKIVEDFGIKGAVIKLGESQELLNPKIKQISEERKELRSLFHLIIKALKFSGKGCVSTSWMKKTPLGLAVGPL